jgi:hypothetical protein
MHLVAVDLPAIAHARQLKSLSLQEASLRAKQPELFLANHRSQASFLHQPIGIV